MKWFWDGVSYLYGHFFGTKLSCNGKWHLRNLCVCLKIEHLFPLHKLQLLIGGTCLHWPRPTKQCQNSNPMPAVLRVHCQSTVRCQWSQSHHSGLHFTVGGKTQRIYFPLFVRKSRDLAHQNSIRAVKVIFPVIFSSLLLFAAKDSNPI